MQAFGTSDVVQPGLGIVHQVNLEYLARDAHKKDGMYYPDMLVGTGNHTTMINGTGVVGWGVGGIEVRADILGQPMYFLISDVIGIELKNRLHEGCTVTDLVFTITEMLCEKKVVGEFVEFFGEGMASLSLPGRTTIGNMVPEYGVTMGFFSVDEKTIDYFKGMGRTKEEIAAFESYFKAQKLSGVPKVGKIDCTKMLTLDFSTVVPSLAGPKRPQGHVEVGNVKSMFSSLFSKPAMENDFNKSAEGLDKTFTATNGVSVKGGDVLIAAIISYTNTPNPSVLLAADLLTKKAVEAGLGVTPHIKTSLAPGSRMVTKHLKAADLLPYLEKLGFGVMVYGCTACIGNVGDLILELNEAIVKNDVVAAAVLSGNRNFEARIHPSIHINFLASPLLVVTHAIADNVTHDLMTEPIGKGEEGEDVYLGDVWPTSDKITKLTKFTMNADTFRTNYEQVKKPPKLWANVKDTKDQVYGWPKSAYIAEPPFSESLGMMPAAVSASIEDAHVLGVFGSLVTTDHIPPAGSIKETSPVGEYLLTNGVLKADFNSYGLCRGNHEVMMRGTFVNVRIKNLMIPARADSSYAEDGGMLFQPSGEQMSVYDAAIKYIAEGTPTIVFGGEEYDMSSSCDWAVKGTQLLDVKAVTARSFECIHHSNLVDIGVLPLQLKGSDSAQSPGIAGDETFDVEGLNDEIKSQQGVTLVIHRANGEITRVQVLPRIDTPIEVDYYKHGGILPLVLRQLLAV